MRIHAMIWIQDTENALGKGNIKQIENSESESCRKGVTWKNTARRISVTRAELLERTPGVSRWDGEEERD
jgi:hypothetical protein